MPLSGILAEYGFSGGWPSIFYIFGLIGCIWSLAFIYLCHEDPGVHPTIDEREKKYIMSSLWGTSAMTVSINFKNLSLRKSLS
jgi:MFS transporter, ACS family, solute carrier family 17 (sodium-dependent inorganic phosphate cotransporter), member 5